MKRCPACETCFEAPEWRCPSCSFRPTTLGGFPAFAPALAQADNSFDAASFARLAEANDRHFWFRARRRLLVWALRRSFPRARSFLEIGCGDGQVLAGVGAAYPEMTLAGSELIADGLSFAAARVGGRGALFQMDARDIPYADEYDVVGAFDVLEHVVEDERVLAEMYRACRPGGGIMLTVPQHPFLWGPADVAAHHVRRYVARELRAKVTRAGFAIVRATSFVTVLLPPLYLKRWRTRDRAEYSVTTEELSVPPWLNWALERAIDVDAMVIRLGFDLPVGSSLLLVARKG